MNLQTGGRAIEAVLLDAAGTLIEPARPVAETYAALAEDFGAKIEVDTVHRAFKKVFSGMPPMAFPEAEGGELEVREKRWWCDLVARVIKLAGGEISDFGAYFTVLYQHYASGAAWTLYPEVPAVVRELSVRGYRVAVVSNFDSRLHEILRAHGLTRYLCEIIHSTRVGAAKPDPRIFRYALEKTGVEADHAVHVGDSHDADYAGARAAGLEGLLLVRTDPAARGRPEHVISGLEELLTWLGRRTPPVRR